VDRGYWLTYQLSECSSLALEIFEVQSLLPSENLFNQFCNQMSLFLRLISDALVLLGHILRTTTKTRAKLDYSSNKQTVFHYLHIRWHKVRRSLSLVDLATEPKRTRLVRGVAVFLSSKYFRSPG